MRLHAALGLLSALAAAQVQPPPSEGPTFDPSLTRARQALDESPGPR